MSGKHIPGPCPYCGTAMANTGAPIWEDYCPSDSCTGHKDAFIAGLKEQAAQEVLRDRIRSAAPDLLENAICARDTMSRAADIMEHVCGRRDDAERLRRGADVCRAAIAKATQP